MPVVLLLVAAVAIARHHTVDQSPWQGVGFGMFSGYDYLPGRTARVWVTIDGEREPVEVPGDLRDDLERVLVAPGDPEAEDLADEIRSRLGAASVRLEILGHDVEDTERGLRITLVPLRTVRVP
jgi:ElaB/YqjD/DUF883 family membrane-anchored ribosome-binding protein